MTPRSEQAVGTADAADAVVFDGLRNDSWVLRQLDEDITISYGAPGLVQDLWRAAYCRTPELADPGELTPLAQVNRAIVAGQLGSPEHTELRRATRGDAFAAALAVASQARTLREMLDKLRAERELARQAEQARQAADDQPPDAEADGGEGGEAEGDEQDQDAAAATASGGTAGTDDSDGDGAESGPGPGSAGEADEPGELDQDREQDDGGTDAESRQAEDADDEPEGEAAAAGTADDASEADEAEAELQRALAAAPIRTSARQMAHDGAEHVDEARTLEETWGVGEGDPQRLDAAERLQLAHRLTSPGLRRYLDLLGRFRQLGRAQRSRRVEHVLGEHVGITLGDELSALIPSELASLAHPALRAEFAARYAESRLLVYDQRGEEHEGQGAIIAVLDCSSSMRELLGAEDMSVTEYSRALAEDTVATREIYAKSLVLALLDQARAARPARSFATILFNEDVDAEFVFPAGRPVDTATRLQLAERFAGGGTNFMTPLERAVELLEQEYNTSGRERADLVVITDGIAPVEDDWLARWHQRKHQLGFRCFGIELGTGSLDMPDPPLAQFCDDVRTITDPDPHATAELFRSI